MFGLYSSPLNMEIEGAFLSMEPYNDSLIYRRWGLLGNTERLLLRKSCSILLNPVEPVNTPKRLTHFLLVNFKKTLILEPGASKNIYITFPIEIGVFVSHGKDDFEVIDIFSFSRLKYTLYGAPSNGIICKYWESDVFLSPPDTDPWYTGCIDLKIVNDTEHMVEVSRSLFNAYSMKIYYKGNNVLMKAVMKVQSRNIAETESVNCSGKTRFKKATELYISSKLRVIGSRCIMEYGI